MKPPLRGGKRIVLVTPCVGVWIETLNVYLLLKRHRVTPCVGVWIETICA